MYYNYDSSDDEWPEVQYRRLAANKNKKIFPTNQNIFDLGESKLGIDARYRGSIGTAKMPEPGTIKPNTPSALKSTDTTSNTKPTDTTSSKFTDSINRLYISRDGNRTLAHGQQYKWANQSADMFNTNMNTNIDARITRFVTESTPFTYSAARMQEYGSDTKPNYITPSQSKYCHGNIPGFESCNAKKERFTDTLEEFTSGDKHKSKCCQHHASNDISVMLDALTSPLFLLVLLIVILVYVVELLRNVREIIVALHHTSTPQSKLL